ncbi:PhzF family phenazine biosynthesis protein [Flavobacteriaceae bacterium 3-367]
MKQKIYQIDAFADRVFSGNPAAVCIMDQWIEDGLMQQVAMENNLAETAFVVKNNDEYHIRWFTPAVEVDLCGHATLASAYVLFQYYKVAEQQIRFYSHRSGPLLVEKDDKGYLIMDFPTDELTPIAPLPELNAALGKTPMDTLKGKTDYLLIYASQKEVADMQPNFFELSRLDGRGVIVSAKGDEVDFVSRFFAPQSGIDEDPVTGSAHTTLTPYWSRQLNKTRLTAKQISARGGNLHCEYLDDRVKISGKAAPYLIGEIEL